MDNGVDLRITSRVLHRTVKQNSEFPRIGILSLYHETRRNISRVLISITKTIRREEGRTDFLLC